MSGAWASRGPSRTRASLEFSFGAYEEVEKAVPFPALLKHAVGSAPDHPAGAPTGLFQLSAILIPVHVFRDVRSRGRAPDVQTVPSDPTRKYVTPSRTSSGGQSGISTAMWTHPRNAGGSSYTSERSISRLARIAIAESSQGIRGTGMRPLTECIHGQ